MSTPLASFHKVLLVTCSSWLLQIKDDLTLHAWAMHLMDAWDAGDCRILQGKEKWQHSGV